jgi:hypothetical protein
MRKILLVVLLLLSFAVAPWATAKTECAYYIEVSTNGDCFSYWQCTIYNPDGTVGGTITGQPRDC